MLEYVKYKKNIPKYITESEYIKKQNMSDISEFQNFSKYVRISEFLSIYQNII